MTGTVERLLTEHLDTWTAAVETKSGVGRGSSKKLKLVGIQKLRELILELAVRGQLVPQDESDEPASVLLERIAAERERLVKEKKIKKPKQLAEISEGEMPFELPVGWEWSRLPDTYYTISPSGKKLKTSELMEEGKYPVVDQGLSYIAGYTNLEELLIKIPNPIIIFGDHTTNRKYIDFDFVAGADGTKILSPICLNEQYFYKALLSFQLEGRGYARHFKVLNSHLIPIPPLSEQARIVAKVDELMALCDALEQEQESSIAAHGLLAKNLLAALKNAVGQGEFQQAWARVAAHFDTLFTTEQSVEQLKQTILQLAVMGKLVEQDLADESAEVLLERIATEKQRLVDGKVIKKQKALPEILEEEKVFELPKGWAWCRLGNLALESSAGWSPRCLPTPRESNNWGVLKVSAVTWGKYQPNENKELPSELEPRKECEVKGGDFLISRANTAALVARAVVVPSGSPKNLMMSDKIIRFTFPEDVSSEFLNLVNNSQFSRNYYLTVAGGTSSSMKNVSREQVRGLLVSLPPLKEQLRIVSRVAEIKALCEKIKDQLSYSNSKQVQLADALSGSVFH